MAERDPMPMIDLTDGTTRLFALDDGIVRIEPVEGPLNQKTITPTPEQWRELASFAAFMADEIEQFGQDGGTT